MAYAPTNWLDNVTPADAANMNHLEAGLQAAALVADQAYSLASTVTPGVAPEVDMAMLVAWSN